MNKFHANSFAKFFTTSNIFYCYRRLHFLCKRIKIVLKKVMIFCLKERDVFFESPIKSKFYNVENVFGMWVQISFHSNIFGRFPIFKVMRLSEFQSISLASRNFDLNFKKFLSRLSPKIIWSFYSLSFRGRIPPWKCPEFLEWGICGKTFWCKYISELYASTIESRDFFLTRCKP